MSESIGSLADPTPVPGRAEAPVSPAERPAVVAPGQTLGVGALMVAIALIGICLAVFRENLGLGIVSASLSMMALGRTLGAMARCKARGSPMTLVEGAIILVASYGIAALIVAGAFIALGVTCTAVGVALGAVRSGLGGVGAAIAGLAAAVAASSWLRRRLWGWGQDSETGGRADPR